MIQAVDVQCRRCPQYDNRGNALYSEAGRDCVPCHSPNVVNAERSSCTRCPLGWVLQSDECVDCSALGHDYYAANQTHCSRCTLPHHTVDETRTACGICAPPFYPPGSSPTEVSEDGSLLWPAIYGRVNSATGCMRCEEMDRDTWLGNTRGREIYFSRDGECVECEYPGVILDGDRNMTLEQRFGG